MEKLEEKTMPKSRIDKLLSGETPDAKKSAAGTFDQSELNRIAAVMSRLGMSNRSDLIHDCVMDAIEVLEAKAPAKKPNGDSNTNTPSTTSGSRSGSGSSRAGKK